MIRAFIGLGSNLGDREANLRIALDFLQTHTKMHLVRHTAFLENPPWGVCDQPTFLNAIAEIQTELDPTALLVTLKEQEVRMGRVPSEYRWGPRLIDLDIIIFGDYVVDLPNLTIPHPEIPNRPFIITQLLELEDTLVHPKTGLPIKALLQTE